MPSISTLHDDLVSRLIDRSTHAHGRFPIPLIATSYQIALSGGLARVTVRRTFRNQEAETIEAALTFPVPVHAVLYGLEARIGGRTVKAVAKDKTAARESYESAVDAGKTAVLHEELLKGVHMLSVAHVAPGTDIEVTVEFAQVLTWLGGRALVRIPTTVGDVYGHSGLSDCDELVTGGPVAAAQLDIACEAGTSALIGGQPLVAGMRVPLNRPIVIEIKGWTAREVRGHTAAGQPFSLRIAPAPDGEAPLDVAFLIDHSGSMASMCTLGARVSKHAAVMLGLAEVAQSLSAPDRINLWQFDDRAEDLGTAHGKQVMDLIRMLEGPDGGTEIGGAIETLLAHRKVRDVVLVTDGMSHALDVQTLAGRGVRFSVVLIGEDSLEANVGHLAALTGGEIFVADGAKVEESLASAIGALRSYGDGTVETPEAAWLARARRGGMEIVARYEDRVADVPEGDADAARAAGALVANLRLAGLPTADAVKLAVSEGLVTHLTSLILVDEEGAARAGLPAMRKVALPSPATYAPRAGMVACMEYSVSASVDPIRMSPPETRRVQAAPRSRVEVAPEAPSGLVARSRSLFSFGRSKSVEVRKSRVPSAAPSAAETDGEATLASGESQAPRLTELPRRIDWREEGQRLVEGNLIGLPHDIADAIDAAALVGVVKRAAKRLGISARVLVIGLLARVVAGRDRHAERVYRAILARAKTRDIKNAADRLGLAA